LNVALKKRHGILPAREIKYSVIDGGAATAGAALSGSPTRPPANGFPLALPLLFLLPSPCYRSLAAANPPCPGPPLPSSCSPCGRPAAWACGPRPARRSSARRQPVTTEFVAVASRPTGSPARRDGWWPRPARRVGGTWVRGHVHG
jgi:hypothetical protein